MDKCTDKTPEVDIYPLTIRNMVLLLRHKTSLVFLRLDKQKLLCVRSI